MTDTKEEKIQALFTYYAESLTTHLDHLYSLDGLSSELRVGDINDIVKNMKIVVMAIDDINKKLRK